MRRETMRQTMRFHAIVIVLMSLAATAVYSQSRTRTSPRARTGAPRQQNQMMMSEPGQPDMARRMAERHNRNMQEMQQDMEEMRRWAEESRNRALQQAVRASDEQWRQIKPKLDHIERLKAEAVVATAPGGGNGNFTSTTQQFGSGPVQGQGFMMGGTFGGSGGGFGTASGSATGSVDIMDSNAPAGTQTGGSGGAWTSSPKSIMEMTEGEALCQQLQPLLQGQSMPPAEVSQKIAALRRVRVQAQEDLTKARQELRAMIAPDQEPALVVMGYLD